MGEEEGDVESEESADEARSEDMRLEEEAEYDQNMMIGRGEDDDLLVASGVNIGATSETSSMLPADVPGSKKRKATRSVMSWLIPASDATSGGKRSRRNKAAVKIVLAPTNLEKLGAELGFGKDPLYLYPGIVVGQRPELGAAVTYDVQFVDTGERLIKSIPVAFVRPGWFEVEEVVEVDCNAGKKTNDVDWRGANVTAVDYINTTSRTVKDAVDATMDVLYLLSSGERERVAVRYIAMSQGCVRKIIIPTEGKYEL